MPRFKSLFLVLLLGFGIWGLWLAPPQAAAYPGPAGLCTDDASCNALGQQKAKDWFDAVYGTEDINLQSYVNEVFQNILYTISAQFMKPDDMAKMATDPTVLQNAFDSVKTNIAKFIVEHPDNPTLAGLFPTTPLDLLYQNPPASGVNYVADTIRHLPGVPQAYAQTPRPGFGFSQFESFRQIWKISRNAALSFFIIFFLIAGFLIMFRVKISPQAVLTFQTLLPRIIAILVLIFFSYAIVGFAVDLMYAITYLLVAILSPYTLFGTVLGAVHLGSPVRIILQNNFNLPFAWTSAVPMLMVLLSSFGLAIGLLGIIMLPSLLLGAIGAPGFALAGGLVIGLLVALVMIIIMLVNIVKIFIMLIKAYIGIFVALITGPLQIIFGIMPGSKSISQWFMGLLGNLAVFPTVYLMFLLIDIIFTQVQPFGVAGGLHANLTWIPPLIAPNPSAIINFRPIAWLFGLPGYLFIKSILIFGIYLLIPKAADIVKSMIDRKPFPYGSAIGEAFNQAKPYAGAIAESGIQGVKKARETAGQINPATGTQYTTKEAIGFGLREAGSRAVEQGWEVTRRRLEKGS